MEHSFIRDFDFTITDVLLAHRHHFGQGISSNAYTRGRKISGLVYCISGNAFYRFENATVTLKPGELIFLPASASYFVTCLGENPFHHITVNFNIPPEDLEQLIPPNYDEISDTMVIADAPDIKPWWML